METAEHKENSTLALAERLVPAADRRQPLFRGALVLAFLLHAALFVEVGRSIPRTIGDQTGSPDAIAVDLVSEADLASRETVALPPPGKPEASPPAQPEAPQEEAQKPVEQETPKEPPKPEEAEKAETEPEPAEVAPSKPDEKPKSDKPAALPDFESSLPDLATLPQPEEDSAEQKPPQKKPEQAKPETVKPQAREAPQKKQAQKQARLEPQPQDLESAPPGRSASAMRPPGITRSGENDEFGRGVVRALRMTMPPPRGIFGRVTVRLILNENGDLAQVQVLQASGTPLDQSVVFATRQTYFPLPPYNSTVADRTFVITYVYR